jgi:hypothetical protein
VGVGRWGQRTKQLGLPSIKHRLTPAFGGGVEKFSTRFIMLAAGCFHADALAADGTGWTWGTTDTEAMVWVP